MHKSDNADKSTLKPGGPRPIRYPLNRGNCPECGANLHYSRTMKGVRCFKCGYGSHPPTLRAIASCIIKGCTAKWREGGMSYGTQDLVNRVLHHHWKFHNRQVPTVTVIRPTSVIGQCSMRGYAVER